MSTAHHTLATGTRIDCYEIGRVLGVGGFGITYQGYDHTLSCDVAIKEYLPSGVALRTGDGITVVPKSDQDQDFYTYGLDRFLEEARILAKFREHSIVRVTRFLEGNGTAYLVMDYEQGQPLNAYLKANGALSEGNILSIIAPLLAGLQEVHAKGYLHRDIKPSNIYLRRDGTPVLLDFGAARQSMGSHTQAVTSMVTPGYAPIEQYNTTGKQGPWTDFYGLGATLYRCVSGSSPVGAPDRIMALQAGDPDPLKAATEIGKGRYSDQLLEITDWMLRPNIADRPQNVNEIRQRLPQVDGGGVAISNEHASSAITDVSTNSELTGSTRWHKEELENITRELATHIGPMAKVLVREASASVHDLAALYETLATSIPSSDGQQAFLKSGERQMRESRNTSPPSQPSQPSYRSQTSGGPAVSSSGSPIDSEIITRAEEQLAIYIGPLAKMIVRRTAGSCSNARQLVEQLEQEIDTEGDRKKFRSAMKV
jgi:serine/threonine protein kinase